MNEEPLVVGATESVGESESTRTATAGSLLRAAREASGLHIAALAVSLKVPVKKLEAIEGDRLEELPDAVFVRALAASMARSLKIDPGPVLALLPGTSVPKLIGDQPGINTPFRAPSDGPGPGMREQISKPMMLVVLALLLGALVLIFLPDLQTIQSLGREDLPAVQLAQNAEVASRQVTASALPASVASSVAASVSSPLMSPSPVEALGKMTATLALSPQLASTPGPATAVATGGMAVQFQAKGESWVEVTDAKGVVVLRKTLSAGESVGTDGAMPLAVIVGRADATQVRVRGKELNLGGVSRDNVARFEVK
jgi:cytoskeleton protein RodZ